MAHLRVADPHHLEVLLGSVRPLQQAERQLQATPRPSQTASQAASSASHPAQQLQRRLQHRIHRLRRRSLRRSPLSGPPGTVNSWRTVRNRGPRSLLATRRQRELHAAGAQRNRPPALPGVRAAHGGRAQVAAAAAPLRTQGRAAPARATALTGCCARAVPPRPLCGLSHPRRQLARHSHSLRPSAQACLRSGPRCRHRRRRSPRCGRPPSLRLQSLSSR
jgi:hypothetical protein